MTVSSAQKPATQREEEFNSLFDSLDTNHDGFVSRRTIEQILRVNGIDPGRSQLAESFNRISSLPHEQQSRIDRAAFLECIQPNISLFARVARGELVVPDFNQFAKELASIFSCCQDDRSGSNAGYIPELRDAPAERLGLSVYTVDGQQFHLGDCDERFSAQSTTKTVNYCLAVEQNGLGNVHKHVGREPSGRVFNELTLNGAGLPHNPMINAGAMMTCSLVNRGLPLAERFEQITAVWQKLAAYSDIAFDESVCKSEAGTAHRNWALAHYMMEMGAFPSGTDLSETLDLYFRTCSISVTCDQLSMVAATLAAGGINPITSEQVFKPLTVQSCLSLMTSCGMYDYSGEWAFRVGLPAKSGVSGAVIIVVPNVMGICVWSPRLDDCGNSVRGVKFAKELVDRFSLHTFDSIDSRTKKINPLVSRIQACSQEKATLIQAASNGDLMAVQHLISVGADPSSGDYDARTPLHLAAAEGHFEACSFLLNHGAFHSPVDRWGTTPLDEALKNNHETISSLLQAFGAEAGVQANAHMEGIFRINNQVTTDLIGLIWSASEGDLTSVRRYIARGVDPNHADYDGRTALHLAASEGHNGVVRFLVGFGCSQNCIDRWGNTPLMDAQRAGHRSTADLLV